MARRGPNRVGIGELPNELLTDIIKFASEPDDIQHVMISHVCSRARAIVLSTPSLWCRIANEGPLAWTQMYLDRSGNAPLDVLITHENCFISYRKGFIGARCLCLCFEFFEMVIEHAARWRSFVITHGRLYLSRSHDENICILQRQAEIFKKSKEITFSLLRHLTVRHNHRTEDDCMEVNVKMVNCWNMPALRELDVNGGIEFLQLSSKLQSLTIDIDEDCIISKSAEQILASLRSPLLVDVENLRLTLVGDVFEDQEDIDDRPFEFTKLQKLWFRSGTTRIRSDDFIDRIVTRMCLPAIAFIEADFDVTMGHEAVRDFLAWLAKIDHQCLRELWVTVRQLVWTFPEFRAQFLALVAEFWSGATEFGQRTTIYYRPVIAQLEHGEYEYGEYRSLDWDEIDQSAAKVGPT